MPATIDNPPAPAAAPAAGAPSAVPSASGVINVVPPTPTGTEPKVEAGSAKAKLFEDLGKKAKGAVPDKPATAKPDKAAPVTPPAKTSEPAPSKPGEEPAVAIDPAAGKPPVDKKVNPWKLIDEYKVKTANLEKEVLAAKSSVLPENDRKAFEDRVTRAEARAKELEDHIRYVDYSKTEEFKTKFVAPYEKAWSRAMGELREIKVTDPQTQEQRDVTAQDMLTLVNLPLGEARDVADAAFGKFADDVMAHRKEIRQLYDAQGAALDEARKTGAEREKLNQEQSTAQQKQMVESISKIWNAENEAVMKDEKYKVFFTPKEGDEQWNQRLAKGYEMVDRGFNENPRDPKLTPDERAAIVRRHAAIRNRAASWGAIRGENEALQSRIAELEKELGEYKGTEPATGGGKGGGSGAPEAPGNAKQKMLNDLRKIAKVV